ncbi:MAG: mandelate racemase/muconate lactonizing protein [SAR202 cluster bacterium]|jgi:L-alanine-DL-glutamate epimerase-like enolase superfamily enzyme|nr:enolase C-terminal domain-like protein [SAR202 cluster bacterium]MDP6662725.1 enolase C-terminal domain-like protein [SAR202 cluster bacterium]MQG58221.1 mandelate racemase/muconate lactonizing protein [SAR202 cluster bacterium]MQG68461.1 mandelate racemase/muconate lactonizing protein [SAR202 cluster bacterium]HAL48899.1 mandelate racemase/muconate lactonizing protein [Dehalococcoidia bacterium]|tara:strand:+ start:2140 stop:3336 length:1197 start_codon:yes stop_codon:yes gene_type:complete
MKIIDLKIRELDGVMEHPDPFWEERLVRPLDVYPAFRAQGADYTTSLDDGKYAMRSVFLEIHTDDGVVGLSGPCTRHEAFIIDTQLRGLLIGADPLATELLWDQMYRAAIHGRKGADMLAISVVDCGLWDLKGKAFGQPVYRLLGGPTREEIPAYASALGFSIEFEDVDRRAREFVAQGYRAMKWFFRDGPTDGPDGVRRNLGLAETLREAVGPDVDIMLDAWSSWDVPYSIEMANSLAEYDVRWLEEPVLADKLDSYVEIQRASPIMISGGEHEYTRWGFRSIVENKAMDVLQPDIYWCGGISETIKICALASTFDLPVVPHGHSSHATAHLIASQAPTTCPVQEFLIKWNAVHQFFLSDPLVPIDGVIRVPQTPGLGLAIDESKVQEERVLDFRGM